MMELDQACKLVAEKILGWKVLPSVTKKDKWWARRPNDLLVREGYLLTGNGMVELMEALRERSIYYCMENTTYPNGETYHDVLLLNKSGDKVGYGQGDTPQKALVLAAAKLAEDMK